MALRKHSIFNLRTGWLILVVINFIFGVCGIILCCLKLKHNDEVVQESFYLYFKLSMIFATCNLLLSVLLLVSVIKDNKRYAFACAFLNFLSLFSAILHIESNTNISIPFLIIFGLLGILFLLWFCTYAAYQLMYQEREEEASSVASI